MVRAADGSTFLASDLPSGRVAVLFTADWCGHSRRFVPLFRSFRDGWIVDVSDEGDEWERFGLRVVPTVVIFEDGVPIRRWAGVLGATHVAEVQGALSAPPASGG